ncbi:hypothetical protein QBC45DRAFT_443864 [Copromyces sp. CBS 386.78]|nr:hypothetical protein QBC45DRAFT_443864 [Copromyces sp. CBS 386.78]
MDPYLDYLLKDGFNWSALKGTVVNVVGGNGHISKSLALDPNADMLAEGKESLIQELAGGATWSPAIFKAFVPGLENSSPETPLLINDIIIPEPGTWPRHRERNIRQVDMVMLVNWG